MSLMESSIRTLFKTNDLSRTAQWHLVSVYLVMALSCIELAWGALFGLKYINDYHYVMTSLIGSLVVLLWINSTVTSSTSALVPMTPFFRNLKSIGLVSVYGFLLGIAMSPTLAALAMYAVYDPFQLLQIMSASSTVLFLMFAVAASMTAVRSSLYTMAMTLTASATAAMMQLTHVYTPDYSFPTPAVLFLAWTALFCLGLMLIVTSQTILYRTEFHRDYDIFRHAMMLHSRIFKEIFRACNSVLTAVGIMTGASHHVATVTATSTTKPATSVPHAGPDAHEQAVCTNPNCPCIDCSCQGCKCGLGSTGELNVGITGTRDHRLYDKDRPSTAS